MTASATARVVPPFAFLAGPGHPSRALLALAVDPAISGVVVSGARGIGKSTLLSSYLDWLEEHDLVRKPAVRIPLAVDRDRLLGGVDLERTLEHGSPVLAEGLLERAAGGMVLLDNLHLCEARNLALIKQRLDDQTRTQILAATDADAPRWAHFTDAIAMHVVLSCCDDRPSELERFWRWSEAPGDRWGDADAALADAVRRARGRLPAVTLRDAALSELVAAARAVGVEGPRTDVAAARVACAHAAVRDAAAVEAEDVAFAVATVIGPRARAGSDAPAPPSRPMPPEQGGPSENETTTRAPDRVFEPVTARAPDLDGLIERARGAASGRRAQRRAFDRGRHLRSRAVARGRRLAVGETLRRAAVRHARSSESMHPVPPGGRIRDASDNGALKVRVTREDLRFRELRSRSGTLFVIAVDASGSMAWHRMQEAKGLAHALLADAYRRRDAVALIAFRGDRAERLLPPTSALARARRELEVLPTGGGTPLASALEEILAITRSERLRGERPVCALLLTDGRANVPLDPTRRGRVAADRELDVLARRYAKDGPSTLVIDTTGPGDGRDDARRLAERLHATLQRLA